VITKSAEVCPTILVTPHDYGLVRLNSIWAGMEFAHIYGRVDVSDDCVLPITTQYNATEKAVVGTVSLQQLGNRREHLVVVWRELFTYSKPYG
jgi:hypothetical protein